jgi:tetratricopeptide (TPR) repeat protein
MQEPSRPGLLKFVLLATVVLGSLRASAITTPQITAAEKAACEIVADFLARGPIAIYENLATGSPFRSSDRVADLGEIAVRVGPHEQAAWELRTTTESFSEHGAVFHVVFPSGVEEVVIFEMVPGQNGWKVSSIRTLVEPLASELGNRVGSSRERLHSSSLVPASVFLPVLLAGVLSILGALLRNSLPRGSSAVLLLALASFSISVATLLDPDWSGHIQELFRPEARPPASRPYLALRALLPLRRAMANGSPLPLSRPGDDDTREVAVLWKASGDAGRATPEQWKEQLSVVEFLKNVPLASLLRAARDVDEGRPADSAKEYAAIHRIEPEHDTFWLEEMLATPPSQAAVDVLTRTESLRTRDASVFYVRCTQHILNGDLDAARKDFREAWRLLPISRAELISAGFFAPLLRDPGVAILANLDSVNEQATADASLARSPMVVPSRTSSTATGSLVRLSVGEASLVIPGGAPIAPGGTQVIGAEAFEVAESDRARSRAAPLASHGLVSASAQRTVGKAAKALAEHNRWADILALTNGVESASDGIPASLIAWRVRALLRSGKVVEARAIATGPLMARALQRFPDAGALLDLSELLAQAGAWDDAIETLKKVSAIKGAPDVTARIRRFDLRRELANSPVLTTTAHFAIHATADVPVTVTQRIGDLLEAELVRISQTISIVEFRPLRVNVLHWDNFRDQTGSEHVLGFYDGDITIPFGSVTRFRENIVAILSHELTHAIVSQASNDNAPHWFQEGVATRMELVEQQENIFHQRGAQRFLAVKLLDPTLQSSLDPTATSEAYVIAETFIRFLEDRYGPTSINHMIASYRDGADSDSALLSLTGKRSAEVDTEFRIWGLTHAGLFLDKTPWPYMQFYSLGADPKVQQGFHFSRPRP